MPDRAALAKVQFDFYSKELAAANPFSANNDPAAIARARNYLSLFGSTDRLYSTLVEQASLKNPTADFNEQFHDAAGVIYSNHKVRGAFTRGGFAFMKDAILNPSAYASGEEWVLGKTTALELDPSTLQQKLTDRYDHDFINEWRTVLETSSVVGYGVSRCRKQTGKAGQPYVAAAGIILVYFPQHRRGRSRRDCAVLAGAGGRASGTAGQAARPVRPAKQQGLCAGTKQAAIRRRRARTEQDGSGPGQAGFGLGGSSQGCCHENPGWRSHRSEIP